MSFLCPNCNSFPLEDSIWWVSAGKKHSSCWCAICGGQYDWRALNKLLVVQTGDSASQAKVFKAHAVPQGLCENLINALKLLATSKKVEIVQSKALQQHFVKEEGKVLWRA